MNSTQQLKSIIENRREWEEFGWEGPLVSWGVVLCVKSIFESVAPLPPMISAYFYLAAIAAQIVLVTTVKDLPKAARNFYLNAFWIVTALVCWTVSSYAPSVPLLSENAGQVLELLFWGGTLFQTGIVKSRIGLKIGSSVILAACLATAVFSAIPGLIPVALLIGFGVSSFSLIRERKRRDGADRS